MEESEALEPPSRLMTIPVIYGGEDGPDLANVARHSGLTEKQVVELHACRVRGVVSWFPAGISLSRRTAGAFSDAATCGNCVCGSPPVLSASAAPRSACIRWRHRADGSFLPYAAGALDPLRQEPVLRSGDRVRFVPQKRGGMLTMIRAGMYPRYRMADVKLTAAVGDRLLRCAG